MSYLDKPEISATKTTHIEHDSGPNWLLILVVLAVALGGGYYAYTKFWQKPGGQQAAAGAPGGHGGGGPGGMEMPPAAVTVFDVVPQDIPLTFEYAGRTAGSREVEIRARVSGILQKRAYTEGQKVEQGDVLFEIDPAPFVAQLAEAKARFEQAEKEWKRAEALFKEKALSARESDEARSNYEQTRAALQTAQINLGYTSVAAPISGVTSKESISEGGLVVADQTLLTRLTKLDPIYVNFSTPDEEMMTQRRKIASGEYGVPEDGKLQAQIRFGDDSLYEQSGTIDFTDSIIDPETGAVNNRAVMPNADNVIMPGQFVRVIVTGLVKKNAIAIPDKAIMQGPQGQFVYVVSDKDTAEMRPITPGMLAKDNMRLIEKGLQSGDKVITEGMIKVRPDAPVKITDPNAKPETMPVTKPADKKE